MDLQDPPEAVGRGDGEGRMIDDERTTLVERYMVATTTSNMRVTERTTLSATDILAAAGMAGHKHDLAVQLWAFGHSPTRQMVHRIAENLTWRLKDYMFHKRLNGKARRIAHQVLHWYIDNTCPSCHGLMFERIDGTPHLSNVACKTCHGTGHKALHTENDQAALWLADEIKALSSSAEMAIGKKINKG